MHGSKNPTSLDWVSALTYLGPPRRDHQLALAHEHLQRHTHVPPQWLVLGKDAVRHIDGPRHERQQLRLVRAHLRSDGRRWREVALGAVARLDNHHALPVKLNVGTLERLTGVFT